MRTTFASGLLSLCLVAAGCSPGADGGAVPMTGSGGAGGSAAAGSGGGGGTAVGGSGGNQGGTGGAAGAAGTTGSAGSGGSVGSGSGGAAGGDAGVTADSGSGGAAGTDGGGGAAGTDGGAPQNFTCSLVLGAFQTGQWFEGGFETMAGNDKWEIKSDHNAFTEAWGNPASSFWSLPTRSPCATNASTPDRVLFIVYSPTLTTAATWDAGLTRVIDNIKTKYPSVKLVELLTMVRAPNNMMCPSNGNGNTVISAVQDMAMQTTADKSGGMVKVGPKHYAPACNSFIVGNTTLQGDGPAGVAAMLAAVYK